ncbi:MAG: hypothetical protein F4X91_13005 [Nitrospinae bacterium]|nr:hypothetical protein [Nitrospinota bacterium]
MSTTARQRLFYSWWESSCERYLRENFGDVSEQIRQNFTRMLFPPQAEPVLPEQALPLSFIHLKLLAGEELGFVLQRMEKLASLFGAQGAKPAVGDLYLMLTSLTSRPGKLSSMVKAQSAFFSLLLRRLANLLDVGIAGDVLRKELSDVWEIQTEQAVNATLEGARGLWRRSNAPYMGLVSLPMNLDSWLDDNGLTESVAEARKMYREVGQEHHLFELIRRLAAIEGLRNSIQAGEDIERISVWENMQAGLMKSLGGVMSGITPWESEIMRPAPPLFISLLAWAGKLQLLDEGETPTAYPGRERLPDWMKDFLSAQHQDGDMLSSSRFTVGGETYIVAGVDASAPPELLSVVIDAPERRDSTTLALRIRFGDGTKKSFPYDLENGRDLLKALYMAEQDDVRLDVIVRGADKVWRFGKSLYLVMTQEHREIWVRRLLSFLEEKFGSDEDRIRLAILRDIRQENDK